jgi:ribosomal-protein-alanine N-acetyltransferase
MSFLDAQAQVRRMSGADLDRVLEIAASLPGASRWPDSAYLAAMDPERLPRRIALVAIDPESDAPAGFLVASLLAPEAELETIAVASHFQRRGLGALLLRALVVELRKEQVREALLEVRASNRAALGFYPGQGFEESGRRVRYYVDPDEDAVLMRLKVE